VSYAGIPQGVRDIYVSRAYLVDRTSWSTTITIPEQ
jgi:hypothetical protein